jgi:hypothetical protein
MGAQAKSAWVAATGGTKRAADNKNKPGGSASVVNHGQAKKNFRRTKKYQ